MYGTQRRGMGRAMGLRFSKAGKWEKKTALMANWKKFIAAVDKKNTVNVLFGKTVYFCEV